MDLLNGFNGVWLWLGAVATGAIVAAVARICAAISAAAEHVDRLLTQHREEET
jgi:hypothetical protein